MSDQPDRGDPGGFQSDAERVLLESQLAAQVADSPGTAADQAASVSAMTERGPALPAESEMDQLMAALRKQSEQIQKLQSQVGVMQKQADERAVSEGGPPLLRYAQAVTDRLAATVAAHPDLGAGHFAHPLAAAEQIVSQAQKLHAGETTDPAGVHNAVDRLERWLTRTHPRTSGKHVETFAAVADDLDQVRDEADKLAA